MAEIFFDEEIKYACRLITEMDRASAGFLTMPIKKYMEENFFESSGQLKLTRWKFIKNMIENVYFGRFARFQKIKRETKIGTFFNIRFEGFGFEDMNRLEISRTNETSWQTSEIGNAYCVTCCHLPFWLKYEFLSPWLTICLMGFSNHWLKKEKTVGKVAGFKTEIIKTSRKHENGFGFFLEFIFESKEKADDFGCFLKMIKAAEPPYNPKYKQEQKRNQYYLIS